MSMRELVGDWAITMLGIAGVRVHDSPYAMCAKIGETLRQDKLIDGMLVFSPGPSDAASSLHFCSSSFGPLVENRTDWAAALRQLAGNAYRKGVARFQTPVEGLADMLVYSDCRSGMNIMVAFCRTFRRFDEFDASVPRHLAIYTGILADLLYIHPILQQIKLLSEAQLEVFVAFAEGDDGKGLATRSEKSIPTVNNHTLNIQNMLGVPYGRKPTRSEIGQLARIYTQLECHQRHSVVA
ncbi:hypothetical protein [Parachitinimonas caeni]|uniref:HTH luxR-type domain-containing protein n=1 Tax=Parachitinimonas caeni TaxID=3031301 RepID=A0ABT7E2E1_9NEIS|nr:hypothetical protein [Parachitinimonas caeni]MDK2126484.1 hypothetical protein [Parachitinimonas caeni]